MLFLDGFGLGSLDPQINPLARAEMPFVRELLEGEPLTRASVGDGIIRPGLVCLPTETTLKVAGLPQSATGQTVIFSGINVAKFCGRHINGFPTPTLCRILQEQNLFKRLNQAGRPAVFANVFTKEYFEAIRSSRWQHSVTTTAALGGGCRLLMTEDLAKGTGVYQDITNEQLQAKGYELPVMRPEVAADNLIRLAAQNEFTLFEYFQTDRCGHSQDWDLALELLERLDCFIKTLADRLAEFNLDLLIVSDHGNIEDLTVRTHTLNPVPSLALGHRAGEFAGIMTLLDIYPAVLSYFGV